MTALLLLAAVLVIGGSAGSPAPRPPFDDCDARVAAAPQDLEAYYCYHLAARRERRHREADRRLSAVLRRDARNDLARLVLASVRADGNDPGAEALYLAAVDGFATRADRRGEIRARVFLSQYYRLRGRIPQMADQLEPARVLADAVGDPVLAAHVQVAEAWLAYNRGDYGRALRLLGDVERVVFEDAPPQLQSVWLSASGMACWGVGRHPEAMEAYRRQAAVLQAIGDRYEEAVARGNIVFMAPIVGLSREETLPLARDVLEAAVASGNQQMEGRAHDYLARLSDGPDAVAHGRRFLALARQTGRGPSIAMALRTLALLQARHDPAESSTLLDEAASLSRQRGDLEEKARVQVVRSNVAWVTGPRPAAIAESLLALDAIEATRNLQPEAVVRARRFAQWRSAYTLLTSRLLGGHLVEPGAPLAAADVELAFQVSERRRARMLLDDLDAAQATGALAPRGPLAERRARVLETIVETQRRLLSAAGAGEGIEALAELERLEAEEESLRADLARSDPAFAALRQPRLATLAEVGYALAEDEALLSFEITDGNSRAPSPVFGDDRRSWLFAQSKAGWRAYAVDAAAVAQTPLFLGLFERRDGSEEGPAARLGAALLERALADLPPSVRRLVIVPDGRLHQVPFDALRVADGAPLGERYETAVVPSASLWLRLRQAHAGGGGAPALVLADPDLPGAGAGVSPERQWGIAVGARLGRLPHARKEGAMVVRRLANGSRLLAGGQASEAFVKGADLRAFALLHLAAHAVVDEDKPERSAVLLAPGAAAEDGLLQLREVVALPLHGRVVVLAACRSASGALIPNEGVLSLARGFFQAGASAVVGTLWPLRDDDAARLFDSFYRGVAGGQSVGAALAAARREQIRAGRPAAAWAGVVLLGDGAAVPRPAAPGDGRSGPWAYALVALATVCAAGVLAHRRLRLPPVSAKR